MSSRNVRPAGNRHPCSEMSVAVPIRCLPRTRMTAGRPAAGRERVPRPGRSASAVPRQSCWRPQRPAALAGNSAPVSGLHARPRTACPGPRTPACDPKASTGAPFAGFQPSENRPHPGTPGGPRLGSRGAGYGPHRREHPRPRRKVLAWVLTRGARRGSSAGTGSKASPVQIAAETRVSHSALCNRRKRAEKAIAGAILGIP
jgi:hypothetical protein